MRRIVVALVSVALHGAVALSQSAPPAASPTASYRHRLLGVYDAQSGEPLEGAEVIDALNKITARTSRTGTVSLAFLPEGGSLVRIQKIGYEPTTILVPISPSDTVPLTIVLRAAAQTLPTVITTDSSPHYVSAGLRQFEERRKSNVGGHFIAEAELRKHDSEKITNLVRGFPGLLVRCTRTGVHACIAKSSRAANSNCGPTIYLDGARYTDTDLEKIAVNQLGGVEFYAGGASVPPEYNMTSSGCGVLIFWTRER